MPGGHERPVGERGGPPGALTLTVDFSEAMQDLAWSVVEYANGSAPEISGW